MTTPKAEREYEAAHLAAWGDKGWAAFNPHGKPVEELPVIYGFNNGGSPGWFSGVLLAEDGVCLGGHVCSSEGYMPHDLGVLEGSRPDRHAVFQAHFPDGYRMEFVSHGDVLSHAGITAAIEKNKEIAAREKADDESAA